MEYTVRHGGNVDIERTIAQLLSRLPDSQSIVEFVLPAFINMGYALAVSLLQKQQNSFSYILLEDSSSALGAEPIQVVLESYTQQWAFQATIMVILDHFLAFLRERRLCVTSLTYLYDELDDHCFSVANHTNTIRNKELLLGTIRFVVLTTTDHCDAARPAALRILQRLDGNEQSSGIPLLVARGLLAYLKRPFCEEESQEWIALVRAWGSGSKDPSCWKSLCASIPLLGSRKSDVPLQREILLQLLRSNVPFESAMLDLVQDPSSADIAVWIVARSMKGRFVDMNEIARFAMQDDDSPPLPPSKRFKVQNLDALGSLDDDLLGFLRHAMKIATRWRNGSHDKLPPTDEIVAVASALRLATALSPKTDPSPDLVEFCNSLVLALIILAQRVMSFMSESASREAKEVLVACAIGLEAVQPRASIDVSSLVDAARNILVSIIDPLTLELPKSLTGATLAAYWVEGADGAWVTTEREIFVLQELPAIVQYCDSCPSLRTGVAALCKPLTADRGLQSRRLIYMERMSEVATASASSSTSLEERIIDLYQQQPPVAPSVCLQVLLWQSMAWMFLTNTPDRVSELVGSTAASVLQYIVDVALAIETYPVREYCCQELGKVVAEVQWEVVDNLWNSETIPSSPQGISALFDHLQQKLVESDDKGFRPMLNILDSCLQATMSPFDSPSAITGAELAVVGIMRIWAKLTGAPRQRDRTHCFRVISGLPWSALADIATHIVPSIFNEVVVQPIRAKLKGNDLGALAPRVWESRFHNFRSVVRFLEGKQWGGTNPTEDLLDSAFPPAVAKFVRSRDYVALLLLAGYRNFQKLGKKSAMKASKRSAASNTSMSLTGPVVFGTQPVAPKHNTRSWIRGVDDSLKDKCLTPGYIEHILSLLFRESKEDDLKFFKEEVLNGKVSLKDLVCSRDSLILKDLVVHVGKHPSARTESIKALERAVIARKTDVDVYGELSNSSQTPYIQDVKQWITTHFMYLLVNITQSKWASKSYEQRTQALRSLEFSLEFLNPAESPQYLPQILATVNSALDEKQNSKNSAANGKVIALLYSHAILVLSRFVKLAAPTNLEILGKNLTAVLVALVPILASDEPDLARPRQLAAGVLFWLSEGELGKKLAPYFGNLPFVPRSRELEPFRKALVSHGVEIHDLHCAEELNSGSNEKESLPRGDISLAGDSLGTNDEIGKQRVLRRRLTTLFPLLHNENTSVRRVVLRHLASLLRSNRELFLNLLYNERWAASDFLTVEVGNAQLAKKHTGSSRGVLQEIVDTLLRRCVEESDPDSRLLLAECFGEVGAINSSTNGLDDLNREFTTKDDKYRSRPPWLYHPPHLHLISSHLVIELKASQTSSDQHKIAFAIQQLLSQMNELQQTNVDLGASKEIPSLSPAGRRVQMEPALVNRLSKDGVLDIVEPFWYSEFQEVSTREL